MKRNSLFIWSGFAASFLLSLGIFAAGLWSDSNERMIDKLFSKKQAPADIVIVAIDSESIAAFGQWPWRRSAFADLLGRLEGAESIGFDINFSEQSRFGAQDDGLFAAALRDSGAHIVLPVDLGRQGKVMTAPLEEFALETEQGFANIPLQSDGIARFAKTQSDGFRSFSSVLAEGETANAPDEFRIDYHGPERTFLTIPAIDVLEGHIPGRVFEGALVLVGATSPDLHDIVQTPFGPIPGVEVHANAIATLRGGKFFRDLPFAAAAGVIFVMQGIMFAFVRRMRGILLPIAASAAAIVLLYVISAALFSFGFVPPMLYWFIGFALAAVVALGTNYLSESKDKRFIRKSFHYYLPSDVVEELVENPDKLSLGGETKELTVLFSDIRGFTTISEKLDSHQLVAFMNEYLTAMTDVIMEKRGLVDKFIGDAIMAFWGAPLSNQAYAADACRAAVGMMKTLKHLNEERAVKSLPELHIGIGIATGPMTVGNIGSKQRFNYTVMGDEVNTGSRLEGITKHYGVTCIASESTVRAAQASSPEEFMFRELDVVAVKGKSEPRRIYELVPEGTDSGILHHFDLGRKAYVAGDWDAAQTEFESALALGDDGPSAVFLARTKSYKTHAPASWNGVHVFDTK